jgi:diguanylate cyclase (GGDEF)-like protein
MLAAAVLPIWHDGRVIADLTVASHARHEISQNVRRALEAIAIRIGCVIARLQAEEARKRAAEELEQYRSQLEQLVRERTADLTEANQRLLTEIQERVRVEAALRRSEQELQARSLKDDLTKLHNRRGFMLLAEQQIKLAERSEVGLWLLFADLDSLKWVNDELGHAEGDQALIDAADILRSTFRGSDVVARFAGDEFAVLAAETSPLDTALVSHRLQTEVDKFNNTASRPYRLSLSWGVSYRPPGSSFNLDDMIREADRRMYETKRQAKSV